MDIWTRIALFMYRLLPPVPRQQVEPRVPVGLGRSPFGLDAAAIFEPLQGRVH